MPFSTYPAAMKRVVLLGSVLVLLGGTAYGTSGQGRVDGTLLDGQGQPLSDCQVDRDLRLGVGFGGFDGLAYATGRGGVFALPVNRGFNRLTFACSGGTYGVGQHRRVARTGLQGHRHVA